jgi:signal recognition particle subunit SEC65
MEEYQMNDILNKGIEDLELSMRSMNALGMMGCKTIGDVTRREERELKRTPNLGRMSIREIKETLKNLGLRLGMEEQPKPPEKTLINDLNMDLILKVAEAFKKSSEKITAKKTYTWEEINEYLGEHEKIVKIYRDQMWNYFHR